MSFVSSLNFMVSWVEHEKCFITSGPGGRFLSTQLKILGLVVVTLNC